MSNRQRIKFALEYLEEHLMDNINLKDIADAVHFSEYHFHRMFRSLTGYSVKAYMRSRRLSLAAEDIINNVDSLSNIAQKYHFSSQSSFTVAFKQLHEISPGEMRKCNHDCPKNFGRMVLSDLNLKRPRGLLKEPTLVELEPFSIKGIKCDVKYSQLKEEDSPIHLLWDAYYQISLQELDSIYAIYQYNPKEMHLNDLSFTYMLGDKIQKDEILIEGLSIVHIPKGRYLRFQANIELTSLYEIYHYIDEQWLPHSDYILSEKPDFEIHYKSGVENIVDIYICIEEQNINKYGGINDKQD